MSDIPFEQDQQLYHNLELNDRGVVRRRDTDDTFRKDYLPGFPQINLSDRSIDQFLETELITEHLNALAPHLWLVSKQDSAHISSLTDQVARGRSIVVTEKPHLHLVYTYDKVFLKPLPKFLLSHAFWEHYLLSSSSQITESLQHELRQAAIGLLRSYSYLITHESDYKIAQDESARLVPEGIPYPMFINFIECFKVSDTYVSLRFYFGELPLRSLKFWSRILPHEFKYANTEWPTGNSITQYYAPVLFILAIFLLLLGAWLLILVIEGLNRYNVNDAAKEYEEFSFFTSIIIVMIISFPVLSILGLVTRELLYVLRGIRERPEVSDARERPPVEI